MKKIKVYWPKFVLDNDAFNEDWHAGLARFTDEQIWVAVNQIAAIHKFESPPRLAVVVEFLEKEFPFDEKPVLKRIADERLVVFKDSEGHEFIYHPEITVGGKSLPEPE